VLGFDLSDNAGKVPISFELYNVIYNVLASPGIWLTTFIVIIVCLLPALVAESFKAYFHNFAEFIELIKGIKVYKVGPVRKVTYINGAFQP
jgi:hypothetical protein